jgi:hypothetical protein
MAMPNLQSTIEVIEQLGGTAEVARLTSTTSKAVSNWRVFDRFPANTYLLIQAELARRGKSAPDHLWSMREPPAVTRKRERA